MTDEHGMPIPGDASPLPWSRNNERDLQANERRIDDRDGARVAGVWDDDDNDFIVHAANHIIPCREYVIKRAEAGDSEAIKIWSAMKECAEHGWR